MGVAVKPVASGAFIAFGESVSLGASSSERSSSSEIYERADCVDAVVVPCRER